MNIQEDVSLKEYTTFNIGGKAKYFAEVESVEEIQEALGFAKENNLEYFVLSGGSNVLFSDKGFEGIVIKMMTSSLAIDGQNVICGAGTSLIDMLMFAADNNFSGGENLAGIPGSVGGAVRGNAGAFGTEVKDIFVEAWALNVETGEVEIFDREKCEFAYRNSIFKKNPKYIVVKASFSFEKGDEANIKKEMHNIIAKRNANQMQDIKSAGSFFINPEVDERVLQLFEKDTGKKPHNRRVPAGWLLDSCGLFQKRIGDIQAGIQHANYFINMGQGTAEQVMQLSVVAKTRVRDEFDVQLKEEVALIGF